MYKILLATLSTCLLWGCVKERYRFIGPEDSPEKNRYILAMEPIHSDGLELIDALRKSTFNWGQQASLSDPDWDTYQSEFGVYSQNIQEIINRANAIIPEKDDLLPPHENYLNAWTKCQDGIRMLLTVIESKGQQGSTPEGMTLIDQGMQAVRSFPNSLERHALPIF